MSTRQLTDFVVSPRTFLKEKEQQKIDAKNAEINEGRQREAARQKPKDLTPQQQQRWEELQNLKRKKINQGRDRTDEDRDQDANDIARKTTTKQQPDYTNNYLASIILLMTLITAFVNENPLYQYAISETHPPQYTYSVTLLLLTLYTTLFGLLVYTVLLHIFDILKELLPPTITAVKATLAEGKKFYSSKIWRLTLYVALLSQLGIAVAAGLVHLLHNHYDIQSSFVPRPKLNYRTTTADMTTFTFSYVGTFLVLFTISLHLTLRPDVTRPPPAGAPPETDAATTDTAVSSDIVDPRRPPPPSVTSTPVTPKRKHKFPNLPKFKHNNFKAPFPNTINVVTSSHTSSNSLSGGQIGSKVRIVPPPESTTMRRSKSMTEAEIMNVRNNIDLSVHTGGSSVKWKIKQW